MHKGDNRGNGKTSIFDVIRDHENKVASEISFKYHISNNSNYIHFLYSDWLMGNVYTSIESTRKHLKFNLYL